MPRWRSIWLVARREILERGRSRGFILSVAFTTLIVVGSFVIPAIVFGGDNPTKVGVVEPSPPGIQAAIEQSAQRFDHKVAITTYPDAAAADAALNDGSAEIVIDMPADLSGPGEIRVKRQPDQATAQVIAAATVALRVQAVLGGSNVDQAALADAQRPPETTSLQAQTEQDQAKFLVANIGAVLILVGIFSFGFTVLTGVVEEKQSRVVEVVLSTVRARDLLMGKVLGIGVLGVVQLAVFITAALVAALVTDRLVLPTTTPGAVVLLAVWFVLGYLLYSTALGFLGALASRTGGGVERLDAGDDGRDAQLLRGDLRGHRRPERHGRDDRHVPPAVGPVRRPAAGRVRCDPGLADRRVGDPDPDRDLRPVHDRCAGLRGRRPPVRRTDQAPRRVAVGRVGRASQPSGPGSGSNRPGVPPACQNTTRWPSSAPDRTRSMSPASAFAV